ncbi:enterochelin esterase [Psychromonas sp. KJ10-10]|uniref:enterochelin esterase n=1 Tax=Psychromonas sp. KJ10-10 TaxID=3391823 RepID=UPI0039B6E25C
MWQDPKGDQKRSDFSKVLLDINSLTGHHSWEPVSLERVADSNVWFKLFKVDSKWRASYSFIPITSEQCPLTEQKNAINAKQKQREWWLSIIKNQTHDPLNKLPIITAGWGKSSALHLPDALPEVGWKEWDQGELNSLSMADLNTVSWSSTVLKNQRDCVLYSTANGEAPVVILLDGQKWGADSGMLSVLQYLTNSHKIAPAHYLLIPSINNSIRWKELSCDNEFWMAIVNELLPLVRAELALSDSAIIGGLVAGQSLGGLSALYAGMYFPEVFSKVISLSGSFWWPEMDRMRDPDSFKLNNPDWDSQPPHNSLADKILKDEVNISTLKIFQSIGLAEKDMCIYNDITYQAMQQKGAEVYYEKVHGGHDWLSWRASLINGLIKLLGDK